MAGPYKSLEELDAALASKEPAQPYKSIGDLDAAITQSDANDETRLGFSAKQSLTSKPDQYIKARDLGGQFGIPPDVAERNLPEVEYRNKLDALIGTMRSSPALGTLMQDPGYLKRTHDDIDALAQIELQTRGFKEASTSLRKRQDDLRNQEFEAMIGRMPMAPVPQDVAGTSVMDQTHSQNLMDSLRKGALNVAVQGEVLATLIDRALASAGSLVLPKPEAGGDVTVDSTTQQTQAALVQAAEAFAAAPSDKRMEVAGRIFEEAYNQGQSFKGLGDAIGYLAQNPAAVLNFMGEMGVAAAPGLVVGGGVTAPFRERILSSAMSQAMKSVASKAVTGAGVGFFANMAPTIGGEISEGLTKFDGDIRKALDRATTKGLAEGSVNALFGAIPLPFAGMGPAARMGNVLAETAYQATGGAAGAAAASASVGEEISVAELFLEAIGEGFGAPADLAVSARQGYAYRAATEMFKKGLDSERSLQAEAKLTQMVDVAAQTASISRDPSAVQELVDAADEDGQTELYINARQFANVFNQSPVETAAALGVDATALNDALASNTDLVVPLSTFATAVARDQALRPIIEHTRVDPGDMSPSEARLWQSQQGDQFKAEAEAVLAKRQADETFKAEVQQVHDNLLGQLNQAGRWAPQVNQKYAAMVRDFYVTMADRAGMTVGEMAAKYPLRVVAEGQGALQQRTTLDNQFPLVRTGDAVDGRVVREDVPNLSSIGASLDDYTVMDGVREVPMSAFDKSYIDSIKPEKLDDRTRNLVEQIKQSGELNPLIVALDSKGAYIIEGGHRFDALIASGAKSLPAVVIIDESDPPSGYNQPAVPPAPTFTAATIEVDGVTRPTTNSNGQLIAQTEDGLRNFWRWFGDSKVVDAEGKPLVVYHGTNADFTEFKTTRGGEFGPAIYMTDNPREAGEYGEAVKGVSFASPTPSIMPVYVRILNPYTQGVDAFWQEFGGADSDAAGVERAKAAGHDGVIAQRPDRYYDNEAREFVDRGEMLTHYIAFDPTQIKSATGNRGTFDPNNPDILKQGEGTPRASFDPSTNTIALLEGADWSSFHHESAHFFLEVMADLASRPDAPPAIKKDFDELLKWFGITGTPEADPATTWNLMSLEEKESYHEQFAYNYEIYLAEGQAPNVELQSLFQTFARWMKDVYRNIRDNLNGVYKKKFGKDLPILTTEVRQVYDRMIASEDAIKTAEAVRNFAPIFQTPEQLAELYGATPPPAKGMVRYYHGGDPSDVTGSLWFTSDLNDAIGWAGRSQGMQVWYVDVSENDPLRGGDPAFGVIPPSRIEFPAEIAGRRKVFSEGQNIAQEWVQYQDESKQATADAVDELQARSIRDMRWQANAKAKKIKELQATAKELRAEVKIDVRREVLSQPLYRAWQFLTGKEVSQSALEYREAVNNYARQLAGWEKSREQKVKDVTTRAKQDVWEASEEGQVRYRKAESRVKAQAKVERRDAVQIQKRADEYMGQWESENPRPVEPTQSGKKTPEPKSDPNKVDPTKDTLLIAIAKLGGLDKAQAMAEWGLDPKEKIAQVAFGKPVVRKEGGRKLDAMAEALAQYGYLEVDATGKWDNRQFEEMFFDALRGGEYFSQYGEEAMIAAATRDAQGDPDAGITLENTPAGKLNTDMLKGMYGETDTAPWRLLSALRMTSPDGLAPDQVADLFGFTSGDELVRRLAVAEDPKALIDQLTDQRMLELHGDLATPAEIELAAERAIHNDVRARVLTRELNALRKATGQGNVMLKAARMHADQWLARQTVKNATRHAQHVAAEGRSARAVTESMKAGDLAAAAQHKLDQVLNNQLARGSIRAAEEVRKTMAAWKRVFVADSKMAKNRNMDLVNAARTILAFHGVGPRNQVATEYIEKVKAYNPEMYAEIEPVITRAAMLGDGETVASLTLEEFRSLRDVVDWLWYESRRSREVKISGMVMALEDVRAKLNGRLEEIGIPGEAPGEKGALSKKEMLARYAMQVKAVTRRVEAWADGMGDDFKRFIFRPIKEALTAYRVDRNKYVKQYVDLLTALKPAPGKIDASEIGYTFGNGTGGMGKMELLHAMLHTGNDSNYKKLLVGRGWGVIRENGVLDDSKWKAFEVRAMAEGIITNADMDFVQAVWDLNESIKPMAQAAHHDLFGFYFKEVEARPIVTPFGTYRGGYVPAKTDPVLVRDAQRNAKMEEIEGDFRYSMPSTGMGFTKARAEGYTKPLALDLRLLAKHIDDVIRFAHVQPVVRDVLKIATKGSVAANLDRMDAEVVEGMIMPWLNRSARQITSEPGKLKLVDKFWMTIRQRTGLNIMFANLTNAMQQLTGLFPSALKVGKKYLGGAMVDYRRAPRDMANFVAGKSPYMNDRMHNQMFDMQDAMNDILLNPSKFEKVQDWAKHHGYFLQTAFQNTVDTITWAGAYNQAKAGNQTEADAIAFADESVRLTQSSLLPEDVAAFEVGTPFFKTIIQFSNYFNMLANLNLTEAKKTLQSVGLSQSKARLFTIYMLGFAAPMLVADAIVRTLGGGWDDDDDDGYLDEFLEWFFGAQFNGALALIPAFGPGIASVFNAFNDKPYDDRITTSPSVSTLEASTVGVAKAAINVIDPDKKITGKNVRDVMTLLALMTGVPLGVVAKPIGYAVDVERGKIKPEGPLGPEVDYARGLVTGKASEASRN